MTKSTRAKSWKRGRETIRQIAMIIGVIVCFSWTSVTFFGPGTFAKRRHLSSVDDSQSHDSGDATNTDNSQSTAAAPSSPTTQAATPTVSAATTTSSPQPAAVDTLTKSLDALSNALSFREAQAPGSIGLFAQLLNGDIDPAKAKDIIDKVFQGDEPDQKAFLEKQLETVLDAKKKGIDELKAKLAGLSKTGSLIDAGGQQGNTPAQTGDQSPNKNQNKNDLPNQVNPLDLLALLNSAQNNRNGNPNANNNDNGDEGNQTPFTPSGGGGGGGGGGGAHQGSPSTSAQGNSAKPNSSSSPAGSQDSSSSSSDKNSDQKDSQNGKDGSDKFELPEPKVTRNDPPPSSKKSSPLTPTDPSAQALANSVASQPAARPSAPSRPQGRIPRVLPNGGGYGRFSGLGGYGGFGGGGSRSPKSPPLASGSMSAGGGPSVDPFSSVGESTRPPYDPPIPKYTLDTTSGLDGDGADDPEEASAEGGDFSTKEASTPAEAFSLIGPGARPADASESEARGIMSYVGSEIGDLCTGQSSDVALCDRVKPATRAPQSSGIFSSSAWKDLLRQFEAEHKTVY